MEPTPISTQALPAGTRIEEFVIERVLGSGGFGITYLARDTSLGRQVVIKENLPAQFAWRDPASGTVRPRHSTGGERDDFEWSMNNFLREAATLASLDHPGIVRVLRKFEANGTAYFVMPFVEGVAFDALIESRRAQGQEFSEDELKGLLDRMLQALGYLHDRGIYHRDIKPGNILITNEGIPTLIDFGSARQRLSERSMTVVESAGYTPFEQLQSRGNVGPWSDLYALGATMVKAMTGESPPKTNDRSFGDPWLPLAGRAELAGRFSKSFLISLDRSLKLPVEERWQEAGQWLAALRGDKTGDSGGPAPVARPTPEPKCVLKESFETLLPQAEVMKNVAKGQCPGIDRGAYCASLAGIFILGVMIYSWEKMALPTLLVAYYYPTKARLKNIGMSTNWVCLPIVIVTCMLLPADYQNHQTLCTKDKIWIWMVGTIGAVILGAIYLT